jgi:hypothetical protein
MGVYAELAKSEKGREQHLQKQAGAQRSVPEEKMLEAVREVLASASRELKIGLPARAS